MKTSAVRGVHYAPSHGQWFSRDIHKRTLYRGTSQQLAEKARLDYDATRKTNRKQMYRPLKRHIGHFQPVWPVSVGMDAVDFEAEYGR